MNKRQRKKNAAKAAAKRTALLIADLVEYQTPPEWLDDDVFSAAANARREIIEAFRIKPPVVDAVTYPWHIDAVCQQIETIAVGGHSVIINQPPQLTRPMRKVTK